MGTIRFVVTALAGAVFLSGCAASGDAGRAKVSGDSMAAERRETRIVSFRDRRGHVRHRVESAR